MTRTLKVAENHKDKVRLSLLRSDYTTYQELANDLKMSRCTVSNFLNCKPIMKGNFLEICKFLNLDWQDIADLSSWGESISSVTTPMQAQLTPKLPPIPPGSNIVTIVLDTDNVDEIQSRLQIINDFLRQVSVDNSMKIQRIEQGSVVLVLSGSPEGCKRLEDLFKSGQLTELLGIEILDLGLESLDFKPINLGQWLQNNFTEAIQEGWQTLAEIFGRTALSPAFRSNAVKRAKQIQLGDRTLAFLLDIAKTAEQQISIFIGVYPIGVTKYLPDNLKLIVAFESGEPLEIPVNDDKDGFMQEVLFSPGEHFSIQVPSGDESFTEYFVI